MPVNAGSAACVCPASGSGRYALSADACLVPERQMRSGAPDFDACEYPGLNAAHREPDRPERAFGRRADLPGLPRSSKDRNPDLRRAGGKPIPQDDSVAAPPAFVSRK